MGLADQLTVELTGLVAGAYALRGRTGWSVSIATASGNRPSESIQPWKSSSTPGIGMTRARASSALRMSSTSPVRAATASAICASSSSSREYIGPSFWWCRREKFSTSTRKVSTAISNSINACSAARTARSSRSSGRACASGAASGADSSWASASPAPWGRASSAWVRSDSLCSASGVVTRPD